MSFGKHDLFYKIFFAVVIILLIIGSLLGSWVCLVLLGLIVLVVIVSVINRLKGKKKINH